MRVTTATEGQFDCRRAPLRFAFVLLSGAFLPAATAVADDRASRAAALAFNCYTCHGPDGRGAGDVPGLAGRSAGVIAAQLRAFQIGAGTPTIMNRIARGYSDEEIALVAAYLGAPQ